MPGGCLFVGVGDFQDGLFAEGLADNLHADGQPVGEAGGDRYCRQAGDVHRYGADITEIHLERVIGLFPYLEGGGG